MHIKIPIQNVATEKIFRWSNARDILLLLAKNPYDSFTVSEIINRLDIKSMDSLSTLLEVMEEAGLIKSEREGRKRNISINRDYVDKPKDPLSQIPQKEYRDVMKTVLDRIIKRKEVRKVVLFGAVARGSADRMSDIDIMVVGEKISKLEESLNRISYDARSGRLFGERFELNIRIITLSEYIKPRGFIKDARREGILLYGE